MAIDDAQLARPYAEAAHRHAQAAAGGTPVRWGELLDGLAAAVAQPALQAVLADPRIQPAQARATVLGVMDKLDASGDKGMRNYVLQLLDNGRLGVVAEIAGQYAQLHRRAEGILDAVVRTAFELDSKCIAAIAQRLKKRFNVRKVNTKVIKDETLTGGIVIIAGDDVIDGSVATELNQLQNALRRG